jgi:hypothetical protein
MGGTNHFLFGDRLRDLKRNDRRGEHADASMIRCAEVRVSPSMKARKLSWRARFRVARSTATARGVRRSLRD